MIRWILWAVVLIMQQLSQCLSSRAKNTESYGYNAAAATFSHFSWISSNFFMVDNIIKAVHGGSWGLIAFTMGWYITFCVIGALMGQWLAINHIERRLTK